MDLKSELDRKREKLRMLREAKKRKGAQLVGATGFSTARDASEGGLSIAGGTSALSLKTDDIDDMLRGLGIEPSVSAKVPTPDVSPSDPVQIDSGSSRSCQISEIQHVDIGSQSGSVISYEKETQTSADLLETGTHLTDGLEWDDDDFMNMTLTQDDRAHVRSIDHRHRIAFNVDEDVVGGLTKDKIDLDRRPSRISRSDEEDQNVVGHRELSEQERQEILRSDSFSEFIDRSTRVIERLLNSSTDRYLFTDYRTALSRIRKGSALGSNGVDQDEQVSVQSRIKLLGGDDQQLLVSSLNWSPHFNELLLASFTGAHQSKVHVWNVHCPSGSPEFQFHCPSEVTCARFSPFQPYLVIGGTYCGQLVVWDTRASRRTPVQRTVPSTSAHSYPVVNFDFVGSENSCSLVSVSNDGRLCVWQPDMLLQPPTYSSVLKHLHPSNVCLTAFELLEDLAGANSVVAGDTRFVLGSEEYALHLGRIRDEHLSSSMFSAHNGPVTSIHSHPRSPQFLVTSSLDWTVKLWDLNSMSLLYSFEDASGSKQSGYGNLVFDVRWSPTNPGMFASGNSFGKVCFWQIMDRENIDVPRARLDLNEDGLVMAVNRLEWHRSGQTIAAGTDRGQVVLARVDEKLSQPQFVNGLDCWSHVTGILRDLRHSSANAATTVGS